MWRYIAIAAAGIGAGLLIRELNKEAGRARESWSSKRREVQRDIEWHRKNIKNHIEEAKNSYDFHMLVNMHYSSVKVANEAYKLLSDARKSVTAIGKTIVSIKHQLNELFEKKRAAKDKARKKEIYKEIESLLALRKQLFREQKEIIAQRDEFYNKLKALNIQTMNLKIKIRDNTGQKGIEWHRRLEERKALRKLAN